MADDRMDSETERTTDVWGVGWAATRERKFTIALDATPAQRLAWLEEMIELAHRSGALPKPRP